MVRKLQIRRGNNANVPVLAPGEFGLATDTAKLYIGGESGNLEVAMKQDVDNLTAADVDAVPTSRTINGKALSADISLTAADVGAATSNLSNVANSDFLAKANSAGVGGGPENILDGSTTGSVRTSGSKVESSDTYTIGNYAFAEGYLTEAKGNYSHAEGNNTIAKNEGCHAEGGNTLAVGIYSHVEGYNTEAMGYAHAEGYSTKASGAYSHAQGRTTVADGYASHAEGQDTTANGYASHAEGYHTTANDDYSHAGGYHTTANGFQTVIGRYNTEKDGPSSVSDTTSSATIFTVGGGVSGTTKNLFRTTLQGKSYGLASFSSSGADYAEYFEWLDENPNEEDRRGLFVTLDGDKIRKANAGDDYILGVVSAVPCVEGDTQSEQWHSRYLKDVFGEELTEIVEVSKHVDEETGKVIPAHTETRLILNPDYDPEREYVSREYRKEWSPVGLIGKLVVVDDGTCEVNGYCCVSNDGKATKAEGKTAYRVMKRIDDTHIKVLYR